MQDLNLMVTYAHVVDCGSFSGAARRLGTSRSAVSKAVAKLEHSLGVRLLQRSTRHLSVTEVGAAFAEHCTRIVDEIAQAEQLADSLHAQPRGTLRVAASVAFGTLHVAPALADFLGRYPDLDVDMTISDRSIDLAEEGYDIVVRVANELPPTLVARQLAPVRRKLCATPEYFARHGLPAIPQDLSRHNCLDYTHSGEQGLWRFTGPSGEIAVPVSGRLRINDDEALSQAVLGGLGLALLPTFIIGSDLQAGRLCAALSEYIPVERHVYALYLPTRHLPVKVRAFIDFLLERFGPEPYWDAERPATTSAE
ncbi:LysR family transcriptional regulator [Aromatoleum petrolei]|uniref:LysR family transcriptional regulator n=1 Tax=Aromatoleum petrolei TaxID=76116 RepID=A0ABX1MNX9_9RHOO|nr:LysR family transcriptional regulator [Aromatoleum petrolei]NMF87744.1 LysR family transcriptional regulator [Aromatoleum petrolei]QTQ38233.1 Transcriptional regulator, LysR family [Aromatoleum petrolei]